MAKALKTVASAVPAAPTFAPEENNRRGDIVRAAGRLFRQKGYGATTIRDIADAVNMRSGSPFYHFKSKPDILRAVVLEGIGAIHAAVAVAAAADTSLRERFEAMLAAHLNVLLGEEGRDVAATLLNESRHLEAEAQAEVIRLRDSYELLWQGLLAELKQAGLLADASAVARLFLLGAMNWTTQWYRPQGPHSPLQLARQLAALVLRD